MRPLRPLTLKLMLALLAAPMILAMVQEAQLYCWRKAAQGLSGSGPIDLNQADALTMTLLPGVGPCLAQRVVDYRARHPFKTTEDLLKVKGIGPKLMARIKALTVVGRQDVRQEHTP